MHPLRPRSTLVLRRDISASREILIFRTSCLHVYSVTGWPMTKSLLLGVAVAFALPIAWTAYFFAQRWVMRNALRSALEHPGQAVGLCFVAGRFVELLMWGMLVGIVVAAIMYFAKWRTT